MQLSYRSNVKFLNRNILKITLIRNCLLNTKTKLNRIKQIPINDY